MPNKRAVKHKPNPHVKRAAKIVGTQADLARACGVGPVTVNEWVHGHRPVPAAHARRIEDLTGGTVSRKDLRPDDWHLFWPELAEDAAA